ncbi:hypothetical protein ACIRP5_11505 [Streptomyces sp. NPDC101221]|uniref:hypothetical protein n=1 Tax=Streptomyces sp. NPDC101221 TaxID=3366132 RepID=UPI00382E5B48
MTDQTTPLREIAAQAIRDAACTGDCGKTEGECAKERIQPFAWHHGTLAVVEGSPEQFADAVLAAVLPATTNHDTDTSAELDSLGREADRLRKDWVEMRARAERVEAEVERLRADRAAVLREAAAAVAALDRRKVGIAADTIRDAWEEGRDEGVDLLRRMADETAATETQARRGDQFEAWLKTQRDACFGHASSWAAVDGLLDQYRLHADTGTPLGEHVCEGQTVGDCECLEQPAAGVQQD